MDCFFELRPPLEEARELEAGGLRVEPEERALEPDPEEEDEEGLRTVPPDELDELGGGIGATRRSPIDNSRGTSCWLTGETRRLTPHSPASRRTTHA